MFEKDEILELEKKVWNALLSGNFEADKKLLSNDFLGVYPDGFAAKSDHTNQLKQGPSILNYSIIESKVITLSNDTALISYKASWQKLNIEKPEIIYVTSIWKIIDGEWQNIFSQDTPGAE